MFHSIQENFLVINQKEKKLKSNRHYFVFINCCKVLFRLNELKNISQNGLKFKKRMAILIK